VTVEHLVSGTVNEGGDAQNLWEGGARLGNGEVKEGGDAKGLGTSFGEQRGGGC